MMAANPDRALEPTIDAQADLKTRFILMVSHEYRTPLTTILTTTELLERYGSKISEDNKIRYTHRIKQSVRHMIGLLNDVLLLHQSEAEHQPLLSQPVDLLTTCQEILQIYQGLAHDRLTIECQFTPIPDQPIALDESLFQQIIGNLLSNAVKFSPHPGKIQFDLRYQPLPVAETLAPGPIPTAIPTVIPTAIPSRHDGILVIQIQDQGIGIPMADQPQVFDRFYRGTNIGTLGGTGLGLTIARTGIERLGGNLKLTSIENQGTIAKITIPVQIWKNSLHQI
jgi:signal transduction histidine kinase